MRLALPTMSPTVAFIWQRARRTSACGGVLAGRAVICRVQLGRRLLPVAVSVRATCGRPWRSALRAAVDARGTSQRRDRQLEVLGDLLELGERVVIAEQAEAEMAVVAHDGDSQS